MLWSLAGAQDRDVRQGSDFPVQKLSHCFLVKFDMPTCDVSFLSLVTATGTVAFVEAEGTIKILLELVKFNIVVPSSGRENLNQVESCINTERTYLLTIHKIQ